MKSSQINLTTFGSTFKIPFNFLRSTCRILDIEIIKSGNDHIVALHNQSLDKDNDAVLLYAFTESRLTGKIETTKKRQFNEDEINHCKQEAEEKRHLYKYPINETTETRLVVKPKDAINVSSSSDLNFRKEDFISILSEVIGRSVANQSRSVLNAQEELHNAMEKKWLLTNEQLGALLGMSKHTIGSKSDGWVRLGFKYAKVKEGSITLWRVSQY
ncbi:MAG: hypothetical protein EHM87_21055 [Burkholderiales bacterium]|nr:MAG: hypothetical protein EHM87_21055 [Burkholderiales bacterium]